MKEIKHEIREFISTLLLSWAFRITGDERLKVIITCYFINVLKNNDQPT